MINFFFKKNTCRSKYVTTFYVFLTELAWPKDFELKINSQKSFFLRKTRPN